MDYYEAVGWLQEKHMQIAIVFHVKAQQPKTFNTIQLRAGMLGVCVSVAVSHAV